MSASKSCSRRAKVRPNSKQFRHGRDTTSELGLPLCVKPTEVMRSDVREVGYILETLKKYDIYHLCHEFTLDDVRRS